MKLDPGYFLAPENLGTDAPPPSPAVMAAKQRFGIIGNSAPLTAAIDRAVKVAPIDLSVLVTGESGTGKEFFPRIIHQGSPRRHNRYIAVNCGAIPQGTIDSELFGHEKGAFTGAIATRKGYFEEADGGTIFLDEVGELPLATQARLLRVLETGEFMKVGSSTVQKTDIRIVAATNLDMRKAIADGTFREDLYYRLSTVQIHVPPLRERGNDIRLLAQYFLSAFAEKYHAAIPDFDTAAQQRMLTYPWPGNVRQLKNVVEQMALFEADRSPVTAATVDSYLGTDTGNPVTKTTMDSQRMLLDMIMTLSQRVDTLTRRLDALTNDPAPAAAPAPDCKCLPEHKAAPAPQDERQTIADALKRHDGRRRAVAHELGIPERTLYRKIKEYRLDDEYND